MPGMANGARKAKVRSGFKREFEFAFKAHSEICGSLGRTRATRAQNLGLHGNGLVENKRSKGKESKEAKKGDLTREVASEVGGGSDVMELGSGDEESKVGVIESVRRWGEEKKSADVGDMDVEERNDAEKVVMNDSKRDLDQKMDECEGGTSLLDDEDLEKNRGFKEVLMGENFEVSDGNWLSKEGTRGSMPIFLKEAAELEKVTKNGFLGKNIGCDVKKDGSCGSSSNVVRGEGGGNRLLPTLVNDGIIKVKESPFRRVAISSLEPKKETMERSPMKDGMVVNNLKELPLLSDAMKKFPSNLKELLHSGLIEGVKVKYLKGGSKLRKFVDSGLDGVIKGSGILCFCDACGGNNVITPSLFELHAGSANKRPPENIYLENGNSLRDVMNACKNASLETLDKAVQLAIGSSLGRSTFCLNCRGELGNEKSMILCSLCMEPRDSQAAMSKNTDETEGKSENNFSPISVNSVLEHRSSQKGSQGKLTRKNLRLHKVVFEDGGVSDGTEVGYYSKNKKVLGGCKIGGGILCYHCNSHVSPSQFESHAGYATRRQPYLHIKIGDQTLHELAISLSKSLKFSVDQNDDLCYICLDGGNLLSCKKCPRAFHKECLSLPDIPDGDWLCTHCIRFYQGEKYVAHNANAIAVGREIDPNRCMCTLETEYGGCVLCRCPYFDQHFGPLQVIICDQCEREFHIGCLKEHKIDDLKEVPPGEWFCSTDCSTIYSMVRKLILHGEEKVPDFCLNVIKKKQDIGYDNNSNIDIRWRLLKGKKITRDKDVRNRLLRGASSIFHERFDPIIVGGSTNDCSQNLIPHMIASHEHDDRERDFRGMCCAILMVNNVVVSAVLVRIFGQELAELPLVGTSSEFEGRGYFQLLYSCIEKLFGFMKVKNIVVPAAEETVSFWKNKFGFIQMTEKELEEYQKDYYSMMVFQGSKMMRKKVPEFIIVGGSSSGAGPKRG